ncbi:hypothetical protein BHE16_02480 [Neomicrococcus aestuarii]|uniref:Uncharacterized protein n=1 Tax=Neomicrococcus aestuarii TaxID=556325 RepID=A0A1L2ZL21_9MICC|nr:hypothetical protein BHE16_02480 [Neomicrococcus aestuarii]
MSARRINARRIASTTVDALLIRLVLRIGLFCIADVVFKFELFPSMSPHSNEGREGARPAVVDGCEVLITQMLVV